MSKHILYLEDDVTLARVTIKALQKRNFLVTHISDLTTFESLDLNTQFTHALLDLKLTDGTSLTCIEPLIEANPKLKILILTGYASIATAVQAIKLGATNYLPKPATADQIVAAFDDWEDTDEPESVPDKISLRRIEWEHIQKILSENDGNISATARQLNMHRRTLQRKLAKKPVRE